MDRPGRLTTRLSGATIGPVIDIYDFAPYRTIVDVAGGHGRLLDESGFRLTRVVDTNSRLSIIEARAV
jgi:hypothetical protein